VFKVLIIKIGALGDVLRTTCILPGLCEKYPNAHITWLTSPTAVTLLINNPYIDNVLTGDNFSSKSSLNKDFHFVVNLDDDFWACELAASVSLKRLVGAYTINGTRTYTENSAQWFDMSLISRYGKEKADDLKKLNRKSYPRILFNMLDIRPAKPLLRIPNRERSFAKTFSKKHLSADQQIVGLNTGAGTRWRFKQLGEEKTAELVDNLTNSLKVTVILFGGLEEQTRNQSIEELSTNNVVNSGYQNSLLEFASLIELCNVLITSDSLALHIASCVGVPVVAFFGPTSANEIELFNPGIKVVPKMGCLSCYKQDCDFIPTCMDKISVNKLVSAAKALLPSSSAPFSQAP
jgi:heptosyltransferase-2